MMGKMLESIEKPASAIVSSIQSDSLRIEKKGALYDLTSVPEMSSRVDFERDMSLFSISGVFLLMNSCAQS